MSGPFLSGTVYTPRRPSVQHAYIRAAPRGAVFGGGTISCGMRMNMGEGEGANVKIARTDNCVCRQ